MKEIDQNEFRKLYLEEEYSTRELAEYYSVAQTTIRRWLKKWEIPTRSPSEARQTSRYKEKAEKNAEKMRDRVTLTCLYCLKEFEVKRALSDQKYCSRECFYAHTKEKTKEANQVEVTCTQCGKKYLTAKRNTQLHERKFCSFACQGQFKKENFTKENSPCYNRIERSCGYCGKKLLIPPHRDKYEKVYCDEICMGKDYETRMTKEGNPRWRGGKLGFYGSNWTKARNEALERDNHVCKLCQKEPTSASPLHVHHIIPIKLFDQPEDANYLDNLVCLCSKCHAFIHSKGNTKKQFLSTDI